MLFVLSLELPHGLLIVNCEAIKSDKSRTCVCECVLVLLHDVLLMNNEKKRSLSFIKLLLVI